MVEKPPQNSQENVKVSDLVFDKKITLKVGAGIRGQFIRRMREYNLLNRGRITAAENHFRGNEITLDFLGTEEEYKAFYQYLQKIESYIKEKQE